MQDGGEPVTVFRAVEEWRSLAIVTLRNSPHYVMFLFGIDVKMLLTAVKSTGDCRCPTSLSRFTVNMHPVRLSRILENGSASSAYFSTANCVVGSLAHIFVGIATPMHY
jgi:hypothetical protein